MKTTLRDEPLGLLVHSMPDQQAMGSIAPVVTGRWKLLVIAALCSLPLLASLFAYFVVRPEGRASVGELLNPVRELPQQSGLALDGTVSPLSALKGQWLLVSVDGGACPERCQQRLFLQRQLRETLGKDKDRVDWVWLLNDQAPVADSMRKPLGDATVLRVAPATLAQWLELPAGKTYADYLFVVDPLGNAMMRLPAHFDGGGAAKARRDVERLLRASASWDTPGR